MRGNPGLIVQWTRLEGEVQNGIIRYADQKEFPELVEQRKAIIELVDDNYATKMKDGKRVTVIKSTKELKQIGYVD